MKVHCIYEAEQVNITFNFCDIYCKEKIVVNNCKAISLWTYMACTNKTISNSMRTCIYHILFCWTPGTRRRWNVTKVHLETNITYTVCIVKFNITIYFNTDNALLMGICFMCLVVCRVKFCTADSSVLIIVVQWFYDITKQ